MKYAVAGHEDGSWLSIIDVNEELSHGKRCVKLSFCVCVCVCVWQGTWGFVGCILSYQT